MTTGSKPLHNHIAYVLAAAHRSVKQSLNERLKEHGIQIEVWRVMECLNDDRQLTMSELAKRALINPPALSKLVDRMVANGLVHRQISSADQRQVNVLLTSIGLERLHQIQNVVEDQDRLLDELLVNQDDSAALKEMLRRLT